MPASSPAQAAQRDGEGTAMLRIAIAGFALATVGVAVNGAALAQAQWGWGPPDDRTYRRYPWPYQPPPRDGFWGDQGPWSDPGQQRRQTAPGPSSSAQSGAKSGGQRPEIAPLAPARIAFASSYPAGSIVIDHKGRQLLLVQPRGEALRYPISVGREGFGWSGTEQISKVVDWPDWHPPADMRARDPRLPEHMSGGLKNPLGVKALYLGNTLYRIHGTNDPSSIGKAASSGCFRMLNGHVVDLASRVGMGTTVTVVRRLPSDLERTVAEQVRGPAAYAPFAPTASAPAVKSRAAPVVKAPAPVKPATKAPAAPVTVPPLEDGPAGEGSGGRERPS
jgi:lipoprotein-anchoring transpeptidase ErfK/SrfK